MLDRRSPFGLGRSNGPAGDGDNAAQMRAVGPDRIFARSAAAFAWSLVIAWWLHRRAAVPARVARQVQLEIFRLRKIMRMAASVLTVATPVG